MWWIAIPVAASAAIIGALLLPVTLRVSVGDEISAVWRVLFIRRTLYPAPEKKKKKKPKKETPEKKKRPAKKREITADSAVKMLGSVAEMIGTLVSKLRRRVKITLLKLHVTVGTDEAAKTAMIYGAAANVCDELLEAMRRTAKFREKDGAVAVTADFTAEKTVVDFEVDLTITVFGALAVLLPTVKKYLDSNKK